MRRFVAGSVTGGPIRRVLWLFHRAPDPRRLNSSHQGRDFLIVFPILPGKELFDAIRFSERFT